MFKKTDHISKGIFCTDQNQESRFLINRFNVLFSFILVLFFHGTESLGQTRTVDLTDTRNKGLPKNVSAQFDIGKDPEEPDSVFSLAKIKFTQNLAENGYYFPKYDSIVSVYGGYQVFGSPGPVSWIESTTWVFQDSSGISDLVKPDQEPGILLRDQIERECLKFLDVAGKAGFPFASVEPALEQTGISKDTLRFRVLYTVSGMTRVSLDGITVSGNEQVGSETISKIARIYPGMIFSEAHAAAIQARLKRSELFETVEKPTFHLADGETFKWFVSVREIPSTRFDGVVGYLPGDNKTRKGYFTGLIQVFLRNFLGNARKLHLTWIREDAFSRQFDLYYMEPWVFDSQTDVWTQVFQRNQDSSFVRRSFSVGSEIRNFDPVVLKADFTYETAVGLSNAKTRISGPEVFNSEKLLCGLGFSYDTRDSWFNARSGNRADFTFQGGLRRITGPDSILTRKEMKSEFLSKILFEGETYHPLSERQILAGFVKYWDVRVPEMDFPDLFLAGGIRNLRGYRENQFYASRFSCISTEYRFLLSERSYFLAFFDAAIIERGKLRTDPDHSDKMVRTGIGSGAVLNSPLGLIRVIFAMGKGDTFSTAKLHFGLVNEF